MRKKSAFSTPQKNNHTEKQKQASMVKYVESEGEWAELMEKSNEMLVVVDFTASW